MLDSPFPCHQLRDCKWGRAALELVARTSVGRSESRKKEKGGKKRKIAKKGEGKRGDRELGLGRWAWAAGAWGDCRAAGGGGGSSALEALTRTGEPTEVG